VDGDREDVLGRLLGVGRAVLDVVVGGLFVDGRRVVHRRVDAVLAQVRLNVVAVPGPDGVLVVGVAIAVRLGRRPDRAVAQGVRVPGGVLPARLDVSGELLSWTRPMAAARSVMREVVADALVAVPSSRPWLMNAAARSATSARSVVIIPPSPVVMFFVG